MTTASIVVMIFGVIYAVALAVCLGGILPSQWWKYVLGLLPLFIILSSLSEDGTIWSRIIVTLAFLASFGAMIWLRSQGKLPDDFLARKTKKKS